MEQCDNVTCTFEYKTYIKFNKYKELAEKSLVGRSHLCSSPKYTDTLMLWCKKENKFSDKTRLKADTLSRAHLSECNIGVFWELEKVYQHATVPFSFQKRGPIQSGNTWGRAWSLCSKKQLMLWDKSGCKNQVLKVLLEDGGLYTQVVSVQKTWWTYHRDWVRSVHFNNRIITIKCYFYFWEDNLAMKVIRKLKACYLQTELQYTSGQFRQLTAK